MCLFVPVCGASTCFDTLTPYSSRFLPKTTFSYVPFSSGLFCRAMGTSSMIYIEELEYCLEFRTPHKRRVSVKYCLILPFLSYTPNISIESLGHECNYDIL